MFRPMSGRFLNYFWWANRNCPVFAFGLFHFLLRRQLIVERHTMMMPKCSACCDDMKGANSFYMSKSWVGPSMIIMEKYVVIMTSHRQFKNALSLRRGINSFPKCTLPSNSINVISSWQVHGIYRRNTLRQLLSISVRSHIIRISSRHRSLIGPLWMTLIRWYVFASNTYSRRGTHSKSRPFECWKKEQTKNRSNGYQGKSCRMWTSTDNRGGSNSTRASSATTATTAKSASSVNSIPYAFLQYSY